MTVSTLFGQPASPATLQVDNGGYTMGVQFSTSAADPSRTFQVTGVWFNSASGATVLPTSIAVYGTDGGLRHSETASWSGAAGSGWVKATFVTPYQITPGSSYKATVFYAGGSNWYSATSNYWSSGAGSAGITSGDLIAPNNAGAAGTGGQDTFFNNAVQGYPNTSFNAANYWVDVELTSQTAGTPYGAPTGGPWVKVFEDHFDSGTSPNSNVWATHYIEGDAFRQEDGGLELQWSPHNAQGMSVANSVLTITASFAGAWPAVQAIDPQTPNPAVGARDNAGPQPSYISGTIQTHPGFNQTYGYFEARIQLPQVNNTWPAFWMHGSTTTWPPEIDIMEQIGNAPPSTTYHHAPGNTQETTGYPGGDYTQWHIYGCRWTPTAIDVFLDGVNIFTDTTSVTNDPMHMILNLAVRTGAVSTNFPCSMQVDYVRGWTTTGVPAQPVITSVSPASGIPAANGNLTVTFPAVSGATSYRAIACPKDADAAGLVDTAHTPATGASSPLTIGSLSPGVPYNVSVAAINATGYSTESALVPSLTSSPVVSFTALLSTIPT